jgi:hypothetical protein
MVQYQFGVSMTNSLEVIMLQDCINIDKIFLALLYICT